MDRMRNGDQEQETDWPFWTGAGVAPRHLSNLADAGVHCAVHAGECLDRVQGRRKSTPALGIPAEHHLHLFSIPALEMTRVRRNIHAVPLVI